MNIEATLKILLGTDNNARKVEEAKLTELRNSDFKQLLSMMFEGMKIPD
jgi:hypothetical protein